MPVRKVSRPVLEVSMWPLNIRLLPLPEPSQRPTTLARPSSTSCQLTWSPAVSSAPRMYFPIASSSPVGLGMFTTSQAMATISSSLTCERILLARSLFTLRVASCMAPPISCSSLPAKIVRVRTKFFVSTGRNQKIIFQAQTPAAFPVHTGLDGQHHAFANFSGRGAVRIGRLMGACDDSMGHGMRRLAAIAGSINPRANHAINLSQRRAVPGAVCCVVEYFQQLVQEAIVLWRKPAGAEILGQVGPIAVGADPNFHERRFVFHHGAMAGCRERGDALAGPDQREGAGHFDFSFIADAHAVDVTLDHRRDFAFFHSRTNVAARVFHSNAGQLVCQTHALDFLIGLDHAHFAEQWRRVHHLLARASKGIEVTLRIDRGLANHAVTNLRTLPKLDADAVRQFPFAQNIQRHVQRARGRRTVVQWMVKIEVAYIFIPCRALGFAKLRLNHQERRVAFAGEDGDVVALHRPIVGQIKNVVGRADNQGGEVVLLHHLPHATPFFEVERIGHLLEPLTLTARLYLFPSMSTKPLCL